MISCGIALRNDRGEYLFVKAGGPMWEHKERSYGVPKGCLNEGETYEECARREFFEETGVNYTGELVKVFDNTTPGCESSKTKKLVIFVGFGEHPSEIKSNLTDIEYRGKQITIPEVCDPKSFSPDEAEKYCFVSQLKLVEALKEYERVRI